MKLLLSVLVLFCCVSTALSCTCVNSKGLSQKELSKQLKEVAAIFEGEVVSFGEKRSITRNIGGKYTYEDIVQPVTFKILRTWKGVESTEITVDTDAGSSCQFVPPVGSKFVLYAYASKKNAPLSINYCSTGVYDDEKMKQEYGPGKVIDQPILPATSNENEDNLLSRIWKTIVSFFS